MIRALIFDLDNTIYPVSSIANDVFKGLFELIARPEWQLSVEQINGAREEFTRRPYQLVADKFDFSPQLKQAGLELLQDLAYSEPMQVFEDYALLREIQLDKYLVTTGFYKLQMSKVKQLGIEGDFKEVHIVDPDLRTKQHVFEEILQSHHYGPEEMLVIGDDPESEIKAAAALGIPTFLFDPNQQHPDATASYISTELKDVAFVLD